MSSAALEPRRDRSGSPGHIGGHRRRQRSVRVTVATVLVLVATCAVAATLPLTDPLPLRVAAAGALVLIWAAARIVHRELVTTRQEHARDRARQARGFTAVLEARAAEHAAVVHRLGVRLTGSEREVRELEATLRLAERRAVHAEDRLRRGAIGAVDQAQVDTVVDLLAWEDRATQVRFPEQRREA